MSRPSFLKQLLLKEEKNNFFNDFYLLIYSKDFFDLTWDLLAFPLFLTQNVLWWKLSGLFIDQKEMFPFFFFKKNNKQHNLLWSSVFIKALTVACNFMYERERCASGFWGTCSIHCTNYFFKLCGTFLCCWFLNCYAS